MLLTFLQAQEIRQYLISAGSDLSSDSKESIHEELSCLLDACDNWLKSASDDGKNILLSCCCQKYFLVPFSCCIIGLKSVCLGN